MTIPREPNGWDLKLWEICALGDSAAMTEAMRAMPEWARWKLFDRMVAWLGTHETREVIERHLAEREGTP